MGGNKNYLDEIQIIYTTYFPFKWVTNIWKYNSTKF